MRVLVIILALLAGLKIWGQEHLRWQATEEALIDAHRDRAIAACTIAEATKPLDRLAGVGPPPDWSKPQSVELVIGNKDVGVSIWDVDNPLWNARYKHAFLVLSARSAAGRAGTCTYDVTRGAASVSRP